jgi:hypothetical protein
MSYPDAKFQTDWLVQQKTLGFWVKPMFWSKTGKGENGLCSMEARLFGLALRGVARWNRIEKVSLAIIQKFKKNIRKNFRLKKPEKSHFQPFKRGQRESFKSEGFGFACKKLRLGGAVQGKLYLKHNGREFPR